ncbi:MAG: cation:proton antiporter [Gammaproteobacteria bacterium]
MSLNEFDSSLILLSCVLAVVSIFRRINLPPILGYLTVGMLVGPGGFALVPDFNDKLHFIAEIGVVFLMFTIGLEFSLSRMMAMRKALLGLGGVQVLLCTLAATFVGRAIGMPWNTSFIAAGALALSSTAVVIKQLHEQNEMHSVHGRLSISILIFQDLAAVLFLIIVPALGTVGEHSILLEILSTMGTGTIVVVVLGGLGLWVLRPLFHEVAKARSNELFMLATLFVVLGAAWITYKLNLSLALGAFLAGLMLGETEFRHQLEIDIRPFRDVLLGFFFITVGSRLELGEIAKQGFTIPLVLFGLITAKTLIIMGLTYFGGRIPAAKAFRTGLILAQGGEFGFVVLTEAIKFELIQPEQHQVLVATVVLSIVLAPILIKYNKWISDKLFPLAKNKVNTEQNDLKLAEHSAELKDHVIICGYGRVGQVLARFLGQESIPFVCLDLDPMRISKSRIAQDHAFYGDVRNPQVLAAAGFARARMLVISFSNEEAALDTLRHVRSLRADIPVFVRTPDDSNLEAFQNAGATEVVPETLEASLMLASHLLLTLGVPASRIIYKVRAIHADRYRFLQGVFKGESELSHLEDPESIRKELYALTVPENTFAIGKSIQELIGIIENTRIKSITRGSTRYNDPNPEFLIELGDILVIYAIPEDLYLLEERILNG